MYMQAGEKKSVLATTAASGINVLKKILENGLNHNGPTSTTTTTTTTAEEDKLPNGDVSRKVGA